MRRIVRRASSPHTTSGVGAFRRQNERAAAAQAAIRAFWAFDITLWLQFLSSAAPPLSLGPDGPAAATAHVDSRPAWPAGLALGGIGASVAAFVAPLGSWPALVAAAAVWARVVWLRSEGVVRHDAWMQLALVLVLFARSGRGGSARSRRQSLLEGFWAAQTLFALTYAVSGLRKLLSIPLQWSAGQPHALQADAMLRHIAQITWKDEALPHWGGWLFAHPDCAQALLWVGIAFELSAFAVPLWPRWRRPWALGVIAFHVIATLAFNRTFSLHALAAALLFLWPGL